MDRGMPWLASCHSMTKNNSKTAISILNAAEKLFIEFGYSATSVRLIADQALSNISSISYYFGSKEHLYEAVILRRIEPWINGCLAALDVVEIKGGSSSLEDLVMVFVRPAWALAEDPTGDGFQFLRLFSRALIENHRQIRWVIEGKYNDFILRCRQVFLHALPHLSNEEAQWRMHLCLSTMFHALAGNDMRRWLGGNSVFPAEDFNAVVRPMVSFLVAGLSSEG